MAKLAALALALAVSLGTLAAPSSAQEAIPRQTYDTIGLMPITPTSFHKTIYEMMERCSGRKGDFESLQWFIARAIEPQIPMPGRRVVGIYSEGRIALDREFAFDGHIVSHEVLHALFDGDVPMDVAASCLLTWQILRPR